MIIQREQNGSNHLKMGRWMTWVRCISMVCLSLLTACAPLQREVAAFRKHQLERAANAEGALMVYTNTGDVESGNIISEFIKTYPHIKLTYYRQNSAELYDKYLTEVRSGRPSADLVWSSAMDLQIKLINDGYAETYTSAEKAFLPSWAVWKDQGYGVTAEPIVFTYDRRHMSDDAAPRSHEALLKFLSSGQLKGAIGTFDPARSGVGFLYYSQDLQAWSDTAALLHAIGSTRPQLYESTATLLNGLASGQAAFGYNVIGSYAIERQHTDPNLRVIFPSDYTLVMSRIAFISARAAHPTAAKLFLDFVLSRKGQRLLAQASLRPVRRDLDVTKVPGPTEAASRPIRVGPELLANLDEMRRARLLEEWREAIGPNRKDDFRRVRDNIVTGQGR